jgi:hypothetical protein
MTDYLYQDAHCLNENRNKMMDEQDRIIPSI